MIIASGVYDGTKIILDEIPKDLAINARVKVVMETADRSLTLAKLAAMAKPGGLPPDFSAQHEHYVKGSPRK